MFENKRTISFTIDTTKLLCKQPYFDLTILEDTLKHLVDVEPVLENLKRITFLQTEVNQDSLKNIYLRYASQYDEDWGEIYLNYCLHKTNQEEAANQFKVMTAFEHALKSLSLKDKNSVYIWNRFNLDFIQYKKFVHQSKFVLDELEAFSEVYLKLNSKAWYASQIGYSYIDPYIINIKDSLINVIEKYQCPISTETDSFQFAQQVMYYLYKVKDERIAQIFINNRECLNDHPAYFWFPVRYLVQNHHQELLHVTLWKLFSEKAEYHIDYKLGHIYRNPNNRKILEEQLHLAILEGSESAMMFSVKVANKKLLKTLKKAKSKYKENPKLRKFIESTINQVENRILTAKHKKNQSNTNY